jgi:hypothetical protein
VKLARRADRTSKDSQDAALLVSRLVDGLEGNASLKRAAIKMFKIALDL